MPITSDSMDMHGQSNAHTNPMFNYLTGFMPRKLKDLFKWTEYVFYNSPHISIALQKLVDYIITDVVIKTENQALRDEYTDLLNKHLKVKLALKQNQLNRAIYGNGFVSIYYPFKRMLRCDACSTVWDINHIGSYKYDNKKMNFSFTCKSCNTKRTVSLDDVKDYKVYDPKRINVIHWDPNQMNLTYNPITGETEYYYTIPATLQGQIDKSDKSVINSTPKGFLRAASGKDQIFKFEKSKIFHTKRPAPAGVDGAWGFPALLAVLKQYYYTEVLRKANEAIALDHMVPMRVLHPAPTSGSNDPATTISLSNWISETKQNIKSWRRDPLHIMFAPVALGVTQMGGQGRTLLAFGEVKEAENNILAGLGVPQEFIYGGLSFTGSAVSLRMLENQMMSDKADSDDLLQWIADSVGTYMGFDKVTTDITPFKFVDDVSQKQLLLSADGTYGLLSRRTVADMLDVDLDVEDEQKQQETLAQVRADMETQAKVTDIQNSIAAQAEQQANAMNGQGLTYDQQAVIGQADGLVEQYMQMDSNQRRSQLASLQAEDYVMYSVVIQRLEEAKLQQVNQAKQEAGI